MLSALADATAALPAVKYVCLWVQLCSVETVSVPQGSTVELVCKGQEAVYKLMAFTWQD